MSAFTDYILDYAGSLTGTFPLPQGTLDFIVEEALVEYGVDTEAEATDTKKAKALLRYKMWERLFIMASADYDVSASNGTVSNSLSRNQVPERYREMWQAAKRDAMPYLSSNKITVTPFDNGYTPLKRGRL